MGKDTLALYLKWHMEDADSKLNVQIVGIADKVKDVAYDLFAWAGVKPRGYYESKHGYAERDKILPALGKSVRQIWIELGTLVGRELYPDAWLVHELSKTLIKPCDVAIIKDVRFANEVSILDRLNAYLVQVENPRIPLPTDIADTQQLPPDWFYTELINDGTKGALMDKAERMANFVLDNCTSFCVQPGYLASVLRVDDSYWRPENS